MDKPLIYVQNLRDNLINRITMDNIVARNTVKREAGLIASYQSSQVFAKAGKLHNIGESLIIHAVSGYLYCYETESTEITKCIPLSNSTVSTSITEMAEDVEMQLLAK